MSDEIEGEVAGEVPQLRPFGAILQEARRGVLHHEASEALAEVVAAVTELGKQGSVQVTLTVKPGEVPGTLLVVDDIKATVPRPANPPTLFYPDRSGNLSRRDPRQPELPHIRAAGHAAPAEHDEETA